MKTQFGLSQILVRSFRFFHQSWRTFLSSGLCPASGPRVWFILIFFSWFGFLPIFSGFFFEFRGPCPFVLRHLSLSPFSFTLISSHWERGEAEVAGRRGGGGCGESRLIFHGAGEVTRGRRGCGAARLSGCGAALFPSTARPRSLGRGGAAGLPSTEVRWLELSPPSKRPEFYGLARRQRSSRRPWRSF
jgi:hypothetical protein